MAAEEKPRAERLLERVRERKERHQKRGRLYRILFAIGGVLLVLLGLLLSAPGVPGPGLLLIAAGLGLLALEFDRAERLLERVLVRVDAVSDSASRAKPWQKALGALAVALATFGVIGAFVLFDVPLLPG